MTPPRRSWKKGFEHFDDGVNKAMTALRRTKHATIPNMADVREAMEALREAKHRAWEEV